MFLFKRSGPWGSGPSGGNPWGNGQQKPPNNGQGPSQPDPFEQFRRQYRKFSRSWFSGGNGDKISPERAILLGLVGVVLFWFATGFYTVNAREESVVLRFGKYVRTDTPGLNYHLPNPIEVVHIVRVQDRYKEEIGYRSATAPASGFRRSGRNDESSTTREILMLTGDENLVSITLEVQWQITDARKFLFNVHDSKRTVADAAESALREIVGTTPINDILSEGRSLVQSETKLALQHILDSYDAGIAISEINMKAVPPDSVVDAFRDVQAAKINKQEMINRAIAYRNEVVPKAQGEAERFLSVYQQYALAKDVTRTRMYLETMEEILKGMPKVIIDSAQGPIPYLPLRELQNKGGANVSSSK
jgi:membrane protease subunit HflK